MHQFLEISKGHWCHFPEMSDHYLITTQLAQHELRELQQVKVENYRESMQKIAEQLAEMQDADAMWNHSTKSLITAQKTTSLHNYCNQETTNGQN